MKKYLAGIVLVLAFGVVFSASASAQRCDNRGNLGSNYNSSYNRNNYRPAYYQQNNYRSNNYRRSYYTNRRGNFYQRNRNIINVGLGTGAGAIIGGIVGGKKGAVVGGLIGAGGSALYTYKIRNRSGYRNR
jgi:hypothetical protein